jgi:hypothetical protein
VLMSLVLPNEQYNCNKLLIFSYTQKNSIDGVMLACSPSFLTPKRIDGVMLACSPSFLTPKRIDGVMLACSPRVW